jgi:hypothetical protein
MPPTPASRLRPFVAALGLLTCTLAGAGADSTAIKPAMIGDPAAHDSPRSDTPHDSFAAAIPTPITRAA